MKYELWILINATSINQCACVRARVCEIVGVSSVVLLERQTDSPSVSPVWTGSKLKGVNRGWRSFHWDACVHTLQNYYNNLIYTPTTTQQQHNHHNHHKITSLWHVKCSEWECAWWLLGCCQVVARVIRMCMWLGLRIVGLQVWFQ